MIKQELRFQDDGVNLIEKFKFRALLADSMGLGKTVQALRAARRSRARTTVVVCGAGLKYHWQAEAAAHCGIRAEVLEGMIPPPVRLFRPQRLVIVNYTILAGWMKFLKRLDPEMIIVDECQAIKNRFAARSQHVQMLCEHVPYVLGLSGTPLTNRPAELWVMLNILWPKKFPSFPKFGYRYCKPRLEFGEIKFKGAQNLDELHERLKRYGMIRRLKKDVMTDLPPKQRIVIPLPISKTKEYQLAERDFIRWLRQHFGGRKARRAMRAQRLVQYGYLKRLAAKLKMPRAIEFVDRLLEETDEKIILFAIHKNRIRELAEHYGERCVVVTGSTSPRSRHRAVDTFHKSKRCRLFIGSDAAEAGWNGSCATITAHFELPWTPGQVNQRGDRFHRIGQKKKTQEYFLVAHGTVEERICRLLQDKQGVLDDVLDGGDSGANLDIFDQLTAELLRGKK